MMEMIQNIRYFDHAATTAIDTRVLNEMMPYLTENFGNASSMYQIGRKNKEAINLARQRVSGALKCSPNEIYFTSGGTESDNLIIKGIALANRRRGNHIITTKIEHPAVLNTCSFLEKYMGFRVTYLNVDANGRIDLSQLERAMNRQTILISVMFANNEIGTIQDIETIGRLARRYGVYFHTDAVQAIGNIDIDVKKLGISALSMSAHKFYGPKGIGVAYISEHVNFMRIQDGGHQERDKRAGTENVAAIVGLGRAIEIAQNELVDYNKKLRVLRDYYLAGVEKNIPFIRVNGDLENRLSGNSNVCFKGVDGGRLLQELDQVGICASSGSACSSGLLNPSHVLLAIGVPASIARGSLRVTFGRENTIEDVDYLVNHLVRIVQKLR